jgi:hypothetical protein
MSETCPGRFADGSGPRATSSQIGTARQSPRLDGLNRLTRSRTRRATRSIVMSPSPTVGSSTQARPDRPHPPTFISTSRSAAMT